MIKMNSVKNLLISVVGCLIILSSSPTLAAPKKHIKIGTAGIGGVYYSAGSAICRFLNKNKAKHNINCSVETTGASIFNLNAVRNGDIDLGIAQSDWQYHAYKGSNKFKDIGADKKLRTVFSLHGELLTLVVRPDAHITKFEDLKDKRVNIGDVGSGTRATIEMILKAKNWTIRDFSLATGLKSSEHASALCDNNIDAFFYIAGHPHNTIQEATTTCGAKLVDIRSKDINKIVESNPFYVYGTIPASLYFGNEKPIDTFGMKATLVTSSDMPDDVIYELTSAVFNNLIDMGRFHPSLRLLEKEKMIKEGITAPIHKGALKFYKEKGLIYKRTNNSLEN